MSAPLAAEAVLFRQRLLSVAGFRPGKLDGVPGAKTDAAEARWLEAYQASAAGWPKGDPRTEALLWGILPRAQKAARRLLRDLKAAGLDSRIVSGTRTYPEQDALFRQGRDGDPRDVVTKARAGESWHNFGLAVDIGLYVKGAYVRGKDRKELMLYEAAGEIGREVPGLDWGGDWPDPDRPHYQLTTGLDRHELRRRFEAGLSYWG